MEIYGNNTYTYTPNGSLLTKSNTEGVIRYSYDAMGNLLKVELPDNRVITYQIDARGRRIGKKVDGVFQYGFIYIINSSLQRKNDAFYKECAVPIGDQLNPIAKVDEDGNIVEQYLYGIKSNIPEYIIKGNKNYKIVSNHLGSPVMVIDMSDNSVVKEIKYDSFGNILLDSDSSFELPFRFAGGIWDKDTKLIRFGVRDYDSETGRWTSKEPLGFAGARNFYAYTGNDSINYVDLDGLAKKLGYVIARKKFKGKVGGSDYYKKMDELAIESFKHLLCKSLGMPNSETGFRIDKEGNTLAAYTGDTMLTQRNNGVDITMYEDTVTTGHTHPCHKENTDVFSDRDKQEKYNGRLRKRRIRNYLMGKFLNIRVWKPSDSFDSNGTSIKSLNIKNCSCSKRETKKNSLGYGCSSPIRIFKRK